MPLERLMGDDETTQAAQALVHLAWWRPRDERRLIFGWVELMPPCFPAQRGHPFKSYTDSSQAKNRFYVARFPMRASEAEEWFAAAASGDLRLPAHPDRPSGGDGQPFANPPLQIEPPGGEELTAMALPFVPATHGAAHVRGLFGATDREIVAAIMDTKTSEWLNAHLFFDLQQHREYLGALLWVRFNPLLRRVESHLSPRNDGDDELVRLTNWPHVDLQGSELFAIEQRPLGISRPRRIPISNSLIRIPWPGQTDRTGLAILHPEHGLCWWREPLPFLRTISVDMGIARQRRRIVTSVDETGKPKSSYDVIVGDRRFPPHSSFQVGEASDVDSIPSRGYRADADRRRIQLARSLGLRWFNDAAEAEVAIRSIIGQAREFVWIVDPYFGPVEISKFALAVTWTNVTVLVVTSAEHLDLGPENRKARGYPRHLTRFYLNLKRERSLICP